MKLQSLPKLQPITKFSPTLFAILKQCPLRAGLRQVKAQQTIRSSKAALLGTIVHRVLEKAAAINRDSEDLRAQIERIWDQVVEEIEKELQTSPLDKYLLPIRKWKKHFVLQQQTVRRCEEIASSQGISETRVIASEREFGNVRDGFTGKPDLILRRTKGLVIIDYKSSELLDDVQERKRQIESWRHQIMFYASIVKAEFAEWPAEGEIRLLNKEVIPIPIDPSEVKTFVAEAQTLKEEYNTKVESGIAHSELARYSVEGCAFCKFKGACNTFWKQNPQPVPGVDEYGCLNGQVLKVTTSKSRKGSIVIRTGKPNGSSQEWQISDISTDQFGNLEKLERGTFVRLIDFKIDANDSHQAKPTKTSVIWEVPKGF